MYGEKAELYNCAKICNDFNDNVSKFNKANQFSGDEAFIIADCNY